MRVLYKDDGDLILKKVESVTVGGRQVLLESISGDKRQHIVPHDSWSQSDLEALIRSQAGAPLLDLVALHAPKLH